jgi:hypothetical protein
VENRWMPCVLLALIGLAFLAPLPVLAQAQTVAVTSQDDAAVAQDYAQRQASAQGLEDFAGGHAGLIVLIVVLAAAIIVLAILIPW